MSAKRTDAGRRFFSRALPAAVIVWGLLGTIEVRAFQPPPKTDPKETAKEDEPRYEFAMNGKPWKDVFAWLNEKTNMPIVGVAVPTGSLTLIGKTGKKYTMSEVIDLINEGLLSNEDKQKYFLIRRERNFVLVPADQKIDPVLAPIVKIEDLKKYGKTQFVTIVTPLTSLVADEVKDEVSKMLSPFGNVMAMKPNSLRIVDNVGNLELILAALKQTEDQEGKSSDSYSHVCKYVQAREAERMLEKLLPDPEKMMRLSGASSQPPVGDPRFQPRQPAVVLPKPKIYAITTDEARNTIFVTGPADIIAKARDLIEKKIDVGTRPVLQGEPYFETYQIGGGNADSLVLDLQKIYPQTSSLRITAAGTNAIRVYASPEDHDSIQGRLRLKGANGVQTRLIGVGTLDTKTVADMLLKWLGEAKTGAPNIEPMPDNNAIAVRGNEAQIKEVEGIIKALNAVGGVGGVDNVRFITLDKGSAVSVAEEIQRMMKDLRPNPVQLIDPTSDRQPQVKPREPQPREPQPRRMDKVPEQSRADGDEQHFVKYQDPFVDPRKKDPAAPNAGKTGAPVTIAAFGNKIMISSEDPAALATAMALYKLITQTKTTEGDFQVIKLKNATAADAAKILDETFNGKPQQQQPQFGRGRFGGGAAPAAPVEDRIRVVADPNTNSLVVRATPVDMLTIRRLLRDQIDNADTNSVTAMKTWTIGPLKNTNALDVANWLKDVYKEQTGGAPATTSVGGFGGFAFGGFGRGAQQNTSTTKTVALSIGVDDQTNTLVMLCNASMYKNIETLVTKMDEAAKDQRRTVKVVSLEGVDPIMLQQALSIFGNHQQQRPGTTPNVGGYPPQPGSSPSGGSQRGGGSNSQSGGSRRGSGGGARLDSPRDADFFASRVKDDPETFDIFFDPQHAYAVEQSVTSNAPVGASTDGATAAVHPVVYEEAQPLPAPPVVPPSITGPRSTIDATALEELGIVIIRGNNPQDVAEVIKVIEELQKRARDSAVAIELVPLEQGDATAVANFLSQLYQRVTLTPTGPSPILQGPRTTATTGFIQQVTTITQPSSVALIPMPRFNAILIAAPKAQLKYVIEEIKRLDKPNAPASDLTPFPLKTTSAARVASLITNFWGTRWPGEAAAQHQIRVVSDDKNNTVLVQAAPGDLEQIGRLIKQIDTNSPNSVNELRIVTLRNALSDDLSALLQQAIAAGIVAPTTTPAAPAAPAAPTPFGGLFGQQAPAAPRPATPTVPGSTGTATKAITLRFVSKFGTAETSLLEDIHLSSDPRTNSILISAPEKTMELLLRLIAELDVPPSAHAFIKVYTLKKADATTTANLLQQLFLGTTGSTTTTPGAPRPGGVPGLPTGGLPTGGLPGALGTGQVRPLSFSLNGVTPEGAPLIDVRVTIDDRTNSIIYAGSENDVRIIEALLTKLDEADVQVRRNEVYLLKNSTAADVANALNVFYPGTLGADSRGNRLTPYQDYQSEVIVVPEPITNKLLISATATKFAEVYRMVQELDSEPPQVVIQVMIAEVDLTGGEEFGVEIGLQSPVLFQRGIFPTLGDLGTGSTTSTATGPLSSASSTITNTVVSTASPGFAFTNPATALGNNPEVSPGIVGFQGISSLGVGRTSALNPGGPGGLVFSAGSDAFNILVRALKTQGRMDILSTTRVMTVDNQSAGILVGKSVPYITGSTVSTLGTVTNSVAYRNVGVQLQVTPKISPDGKVIMRVLPEVSKVDNATGVSIGNGTTAVAFDVQNVETTVLAQDGETVAIGGLIQKTDIKTENRVPWLGDLPYVGALFRFRTQAKSKQELIVILTPTIVRNRFEAQRLLCDDASKMNWCRNDVERLYGPIGLDQCPNGGCANGVDGTLPQNPLFPVPSPAGPGPGMEVIPPPRTVPTPSVAPQQKLIPTPASVPVPQARFAPPAASMPPVIQASAVSTTVALPPVPPMPGKLPDQMPPPPPVFAPGR